MQQSQLRGDDCTLIFDRTIVTGPTGSLRIKGDLDECWRRAIDAGTGTRVENTGDVPSVPVDTSDDPVTGNLVVRFSAASGFVGQFQAGEMVVLRGFLSPTRLAAIEKQFAFVSTVDTAGNRLILDLPRAGHTRAEDAAEMGKSVGDPFTFRYRYYPAGAPQVPENALTSPTGEGAMSTRVKILRTSVLLADKVPGGHRVTVADASGFQPGDLIYLSDDRREVDINPARNFLSLVNMEILTCMAVEGTVRLTSGGSSGSPIRLVGRLVATGTTQAIDLRLGPSTAGPTITVGSKFNGGSDPHLILHRHPA